MAGPAGWGRVHGRATALAVVLALGVPAALAAASVIPDVSDAPGGAQPIELLPAKATELIEHAGDQDWYTIIGRNTDDSVNAVFVRVLQTTATCSGPLKVALFNPEGRWMRTALASAGDVATVLTPGKPSRYRLDVSSTDPACAGIEYEVTFVQTDPPTPDSHASKCLVARARTIDARDRLKFLQTERAKYAPDSRMRYDGYIAKAKTALSAARRAEKRVCA